MTDEFPIESSYLMHVNVTTKFLLGRTNALVDINGCPYIMLLLVLDLDTVRFAFIPLLENNSIGKVSNVTLNLITHLETKLIGLDACLETIPKPVVIQVLPNKDKQ